jgi:hypothetical protein
VVAEVRAIDITLDRLALTVRMPESDTP